MKHVSFPDIGQYRNLIRNVTSRAQYVGNDVNGDPIYDPLKPLPVLELEGTVKLHGTNAAIAYDYTTKEYWLQSRERLLSVGSDNAGFAAKYADQLDKLLPLFDIGSLGATNAQVIIYGEWCGQGIQKGVSVSQLPKMFVVFAVRQTQDEVTQWLPSEIVKKIRLPEAGIYNIYDYPTWKISINFADPISSQNQLQDLTLEVERNCPVGAAFGKEGTGEGIVWKVITPGWEDSKFWMKVKGEKHSVSKVRTLAAVDMETVNSQKEFVANTVTEARCLQSISKLKEAGKPTDRTSLGDFIRWIYNDIVKEESDTAKANGIDLDKLGGPIAQAAKAWFFKNEASL
jgi:hypothetical protein